MKIGEIIRIKELPELIQVSNHILQNGDMMMCQPGVYNYLRFSGKMCEMCGKEYQIRYVNTLEQSVIVKEGQNFYSIFPVCFDYVNHVHPTEFPFQEDLI